MNREQIASIIEDRLAGTEQFLVDVQLSPSRLSVFIDKPSGITVAECVSLSRFLYEKLGEEGFLETHELEVSSPGMDQPLKVYKQYLRRIGKQMKVVTHDGQLHSGTLKKADEEGIDLIEKMTVKENKKKIISEKEFHISFPEIKRATLIF